MLTAALPTDAVPSETFREDVVAPSESSRQDAVAPSSTRCKKRCEASTLDENAHLRGKAKPTDQYRFFHSIRVDCLECVEYWLEVGMDPSEGSSEHPDWDAFAWAHHFDAKRPDCI